MNLQTEQYLTQSKRWPASGRHILAQFDAETVLVYQAWLGLDRLAEKLAHRSSGHRPRCRQQDGGTTGARL